MKKIFLLLALLLCVLSGFSQNFPFGQITVDDFNYDKNKIDSNANAVVFKEFGTSSIHLNEYNNRFELIFEYHVKIKIFNKEGYNQANIIIPLYKSDSRVETLDEVKASTYNLKDGKLIQTEMDKKVVFTEDRSKYVSLTKFTLPNIKDGSIIEYSYRLQSPNIFNFKTWSFQTSIPKLYSEYLVFIPATYNYNVYLRGAIKLSETKSEVSKECMWVNGVPIDCSKIWYIMKNIPAFIEEDFMTAASNFKSAIYFELSDWQMPDGRKESYSKTWKDVDYELTSHKALGSQMKRKDLFKDEMPAILKNATDDLGKAKAVYQYIKKEIKWNSYYGIYSEDNIKKVLNSHSGNVADINLALISALTAANLDAEAVILSTRENGNVNNLYPVISEFNYLVAKVNIGNQTYLLDATEPLLPFGLLPLRCLNDKGRVINLKKSSYWIDLRSKERSIVTYLMDAKLTAEGKIKGTISTYSSGYDAFNKRREIKKFSTVDEYVEDLNERLPKFKISKHEIKDLDNVEESLSEVYDVEISMLDGVDKQVDFNPFMINSIRKNPFNLSERTYPVDLGNSSIERIIIKLTLPGEFELIEKPKDMSISLPNKTGKYVFQTQFQDNVLSLSQTLEFSQAVYPADYYLALKEFYSRIIQNQKANLQLKKVN